MPTIHPPPGSQSDLFGPQKLPLWQTTNIRWIIEEGEHKGRRCILKSSFDTKDGMRFGRVVLEDTREEIVLPVADFRLVMETVVPPGLEPFSVRRRPIPSLPVATSLTSMRVRPVEAPPVRAA
ncbi:hypothetical protein HUE56_30140 (plasmid) [Azospirillum oryzae]|jgi:hypothetical protein|uniref:Uncharacterized protein n=1 Tax=Azospirillum oryzae TaxID=286727 RepID=A0A6N1ASM2_9PROT|nr:MULTISPECIES: hypothetical protein [Azospirillum]KAA0585339.1 hypothetical protein FZ938_25455 [Azospirillum oryzae]PWC86771.1 hypothetical protein TSO5_24460 [Azospirillum sp. TSO5]QCG99299.1 hypothetical protein E6C67_36550 [Azospirillum sp. TSA2s]QKS54761.1 hypothetical protein HUE56_30140 [Azospirillum oryzae]GLR77343.1 hypothetical protein GCM10007856_00110 [Azospirillum oryzae]